MTPSVLQSFRFGLEGFESNTANMLTVSDQGRPRAARAAKKCSKILDPGDLLCAMPRGP